MQYDPNLEDWRRLVREGARQEAELYAYVIDEQRIRKITLDDAHLDRDLDLLWVSGPLDRSWVSKLPAVIMARCNWPQLAAVKEQEHGQQYAG